MPNRNVEGDYRYAFQGQEKDPETGKEAFELRLWDSRIGRWLTIDPAGEFFSPYMGMANNPISIIDPDGRCTKCPKKADVGDTFDHPEFGQVTYTEAGGWTGANGGSILNDVIISSTNGPQLSGLGRAGEQVALPINQVTGLDRITGQFQLQFALHHTRQATFRGVRYDVDEMGVATGNGHFPPQAGLGAAGLAGGGSFKIATAFRNAIAAGKGGLAPAGRALQKHQNITRLVTTEIIKTNAQRNHYAAEALKYIIRNGAKNPKVGKIDGQAVNFIDFKLPNGLGARFFADSNKFFGFLGRGL